MSRNPSLRRRHDQWSVFGPTYLGVPPPVVIPRRVPEAWPRYGIRNSAFYGFGGGPGCGPSCGCQPCRAAVASLQGMGMSMTATDLLPGMLGGIILAGVLVGIVVIASKE